jgi:hypothetical protein
MKTVSHLLWIPAGAAGGFLASFIVGDLILLPVDLYYLIYFGIVLGFVAIYTKTTGLDLRKWTTRRLAWGLALGALGGLVLMQGVLVRPATEGLTGATLVWALAWRGVAYGLVDGLLLLAFPWIVVWRALNAEDGGWPRRAGAGALAWIAILLVTTTYHLGYGEFRSARIAQPNIGSTIGAVPTIVSGNPAASVLSHVFLHVTAVIHSPETDLFLPPHRDARHGQAVDREAKMARGAPSGR